MPTVDLKLPFEEFAFKSLAEYAKEVPGGKLTPKMWLEQMAIIHKAWHAFRDEKKARAKRFVPPTPAEVEAYSISIGWPLDGNSWCSGYEVKDWCTSGTTKMRSWQAAVRKWKAEGWTTKNKPRAATSGGIPEVPNWYDFMKRNFPDWVRFKQGGPEVTWARLAPDERKMILEKMGGK